MDALDAENVSTAPSTSEIPEIDHDEPSVTAPPEVIVNDDMAEKITTPLHQESLATEQSDNVEEDEVKKTDEIGSIPDQTDTERNDMSEQAVKDLSTVSEVTQAQLHVSCG